MPQVHDASTMAGLADIVHARDNDIAL